MFVAENMSEEMSMLSGRGTRVDSSAPQQQEITVDNHRPHMSIDELLEVLKGDSATPVLLVPYGDGRLSAIAMNGVQNMVTTTREVNGSAEKKLQDFRAWMLLIMSLIATVTFTAGLTPPGGFWSEDKDGNVAGTSIMRKKFRTRWSIYHICNTFAFCLSLMIIATLAINFGDKTAAVFRSNLFPALVISCFLVLAGSYISGTWENEHLGAITISCFVFVFVYITLKLLPTWRASRRSGQQPTDTNNS